MKKTDKQKLFEAFEKVCKIKLIKEEKSPRELLKEFLIDNIDFEGYEDLDYINHRAQGDDKIVELFKVFEKEKDYDIKRVGVTKALIDWIRGLPNMLSSLPTYYDELRNLLYAIGYIDTRDVDDEIVDRTFYNRLAKIILDTADQ
jgi:hypothetical protein